MKPGEAGTESGEWRTLSQPPVSSEVGDERYQSEHRTGITITLHLSDNIDVVILPHPYAGDFHTHYDIIDEVAIRNN